MIDKELKKKIIRLINNYALKVKGLSVGITDKEKTLFEYHHGVINRYRTRNGSDKMFSIGSNTKFLTQFCIFQLEDKGMIDLDEDIKTYVPELQLPSIYDETKITIRLMLTHRSGMTDTSRSLLFGCVDQKEMIDIINKSYLCAKPGDMYSYSNNAFEVLGVIIEKVSGMTFKEYVTKNVIIPLGLEGVIANSMDIMNQYKGTFSEGFLPDLKVNQFKVWGHTAAGSHTYMTMNGLLKLMRIVIDPYQQDVVNPKLIERMKLPNDFNDNLKEERTHRTGVLENQYHFAEYDVTLYGHGGATMDHYTLFDILEGYDIGIVIRSNTYGSTLKMILLQSEIFKVLLEHLNPPKKKHIPTNDFDEYYLGKYASVNDIITIEKNKDGRIIVKAGIKKAYLLPMEDGFYETVPIGKTKQLYKKMPIKKIAFKFYSHNGERRIATRNYIEDDVYMTSTIAKEYIETKDIDSYDKYLGNYKCIKPTGIFKADDVTLLKENGDLYIVSGFFGINNKYLAYGHNGDKVILQGHGRGSGEVIYFKENEKDISAFISGLEYKKE